MMLFVHATRGPRRGGWIAAVGAAGLLFGSACSSKSDAETEYPEPPPRAGAEQPAGDEPAAPADPPKAAQPETGQPQQSQQPAQPGAPQPGAAQPETPAQGGEVSEQEVTQFVAAYSSIMKLQTDYQQEFQQAETPEEAQKLQQRAEQEVSDAIEAEGLTPQRFDEIARQAEMDPDLRQRVQQELGGPGQP